MITFLPDASLLTIITLRLIQRSLCSTDLKLTAATKGLNVEGGRAASYRLRQGLAEKQILEKLVPRIAERFAAKIGAETRKSGLAA